MTRKSTLQLPKVLVSVILDYEGSLIQAWQRDFVQNTYIEAYKRYFGDQITFKRICRANVYLPLYVHFSNWLQDEKVWVRRRPSMKYMKSWRRHFPEQCVGLKKKGCHGCHYAINVLKAACNKCNKTLYAKWQLRR